MQKSINICVWIATLLYLHNVYVLQRPSICFIDWIVMQHLLGTCQTLASLIFPFCQGDFTVKSQRALAPSQHKRQQNITRILTFYIRYHLRLCQVLQSMLLKKKKKTKKKKKLLDGSHGSQLLIIIPLLPSLS